VIFFLALLKSSSGLRVIPPLAPALPPLGGGGAGDSSVLPFKAGIPVILHYHARGDATAAGAEAHDAVAPKSVINFLLGFQQSFFSGDAAGPGNILSVLRIPLAPWFTGSFALFIDVRCDDRGPARRTNHCAYMIPGNTLEISRGFFGRMCMSGSGNLAIPGIVLIVIFCALAGCSGIGPAKTAASGTGGSGSGSSNGGGGSGESGFPQYASFTFACTGSWTESSNHHGTFSMTGTMPFTLDYPWDDGTGVALYTSDTGKNNGGTPLHVKSEVWDGGLTTEADSQPCHFTWEGDVGASGLMNYQNRKWTVSFLPVALDTEAYRTISTSQDSPDCPAEYNSPEFVHPDLYQPESDCMVSKDPVLFDFSTGSGFDLPPHKPGKSWDTFSSHVSFSRGRAPG